MITIIGQVKNGGRTVKQKPFRAATRGEARFNADAWAETQYRVMKGEGKKVTHWQSMERT